MGSIPVFFTLSSQDLIDLLDGLDLVYMTDKAGLLLDENILAFTGGDAVGFYSSHGSFSLHSDSGR